MTGTEVARFALGALSASRVRSALMLLAMSIGVAAVVVLTSLGEGARRFVTGEFSALGTNLLVVLPGASETTGGPPPILGVTPRDMTLDDAQALARSRHVRHVAPVVVGVAAVSHGSLSRETVVAGSTSELFPVRHLEMYRGRFLPPGDPDRGSPVVVLGTTVARELFGTGSSVGDWVRIGDRRFRVIGELASTGRSLGMDLDQVAMIPVSQAQSLFNAPSLFRVLVQASSREQVEAARQHIVDTIRERHEGEVDVTVITQDSMVGTFDRIFGALTLTVGGIAAISLVVAGILVMNIMLVAVSQRTAEVGLLKALGAKKQQVMSLFLAEAALLSASGAVCGLAVGYGAVAAIGWAWPAFPAAVPAWAAVAALGVASATGLLFGVWPARRAARLDPVLALSGQHRG